MMVKCLQNKKILLDNQVSVFFNQKYLVNELTSDFHFLHLDRHE